MLYKIPTTYLTICYTQFLQKYHHMLYAILKTYRNISYTQFLKLISQVAIHKSYKNSHNMLYKYAEYFLYAIHNSYNT